MTKTKHSIAALVAVGFAALPFAANAQTSQTGAGVSTHSTPGAPVQQGTIGSSGQRVGTTTAPSVGTSTQPSVGVTNSVPTWNNTNPSTKR